jgi:hypothetical protein
MLVILCLSSRRCDCKGHCFSNNKKNKQSEVQRSNRHHLIADHMGRPSIETVKDRTAAISTSTGLEIFDVHRPFLLFIKMEFQT